MKSVTFFNNKGGVGKTTTIVNLASYLSIYKNKKILLLDLDPQSNSTQAIIPEDIWLDYYGDSPTKKTIYDVFNKMENGEIELNLFEVPVKSIENEYKIDLIPGHPNLSIIDDLMSKSWNETIGVDKGAIRKLNWLNRLNKYYDNYDYIFIDVGPSLGALNRSALINSDFFLSPMASDIFSLLGVDNIEKWMSRWMDLYSLTLNNFREQYKNTDINQFFNDFDINTKTEKTTRFIGYSIQQYSKRKFKSGERPTQAYENIIKNIDSRVIHALGKYRKNNIPDANLKLGDVPYVYSIVPLSQSSNVPIFELTYSSGLRGNQSSSVNEYKSFMDIIANNFLRNVGDSIE